MGKPLSNLTGKVFGRLTVHEYVGHSKWRCSCECGGEACCRTSNLNKGNSKSCGCANYEAHFKHGMSNTPIYKAWQAMHDRCKNLKNRHYKNYGGRGITVCDRWQEFSSFLADMGMRPKGFEVDRRDNDGPYSPENCRWVTRRANLNNRRLNNLVEFNGEVKTVTEWAKVLDIHEETLRHRVNRGWPPEKALTNARQKGGGNSKYTVRQRKKPAPT